MLHMLRKLGRILKEAKEMEEKGEEKRRVSGTKRIWLLGLIPLRLTYERTTRLGKPYERDIPLVNVFYKNDHISVVAYLPYKLKELPRVEVVDGKLVIAADTSKGKVGRTILTPENFKIGELSLEHETLRIELYKREEA